MNKWIEFLKNNDFTGIKKYIREGADVNEANENGESVLASSLRYRCDFDLIMLLIENGADIWDFDEEGVTIFDMAVTYGNMEMVKYMISKGVDVNSTKRRSRFTPLMAAACYGRVEIAKLLIECGADKNAVDVKGISVVDFARKTNKKSILLLLDYDENAPKNRNYAR
ncbi:ankyrin repeat domain-containing protein [Sulfurimonas sp. CVO]|jgi:ankyrin repeat protein|uniref:Ankyrin repeat domain-containing protein n=1 Tax=Sulfurimonas xiamenensis TaxID=2590021 RepID=A0AAJ4DMM9_9BACT|nr:MULTISPECIES: ankyrin repeat domain-containing protein [Sulfurimonas]QFR43314.1 ankyrin repeat domain-containing protein [Sulfurimonas xiamenensis]QHG91125.1 ankyrin repeat domain-containing protein [Sulfurimonas sp. CVO]